jgi:hypothetical protein
MVTKLQAKAGFHVQEANEISLKMLVAAWTGTKFTSNCIEGRRLKGGPFRTKKESYGQPEKGKR